MAGSTPFQETVTALPGATVFGVTRIDGGTDGDGEGGGVAADTTTAALQAAVRINASVTVHENGLVPTGNSAPDAGEQLALTGEAPPVTVGLNVTGTGLPFDDDAVGTGQLIDGIGEAPELGVIPDASADGSLSDPVELYARTIK